MNISYLLGSGISISAGMPATSALTQTILEGKGFKRHTSGKYIRSNGPNQDWDNTTGKVLEFLGLLSKHTEHFYRSRLDRSINYEDLYYVSSQIADTESFEFENPIVVSFINEIAPMVDPLLKRQHKNDYNYWELSTEATNYISNVIEAELLKAPGSLTYLHPLLSIVKELPKYHFNIFTLNHDLVLDTVISELGLKNFDGFGPLENGIAYFDPSQYDIDCRIKLMKLHGAVNWYGYETGLGKLIKYNSKQPLSSEQSIILVGTFNKMLQYTNWYFFELFYRFHLLLSQSQFLIICGYSFGDKGINTRILRWLDSSPDHIMALIHHSVEAMIQKARGAIRNSWERHLKSGKIRILEKKVEDIQPEEMFELIK